MLRTPVNMKQQNEALSKICKALQEGISPDPIGLRPRGDGVEHEYKQGLPSPKPR